MDIKKREDLTYIGITNKSLLDDLVKWDYRNGEITPEGKTRINWILKLHKDYHYDWNQMEIEVPIEQIGRDRGYVRADLVIYRDADFDQNFEWIKQLAGVTSPKPPSPLIVFEFKAKGQFDGKNQAEGYAQKLNAEFWVWTNGDENQFYRTRYPPRQSERISDIPQMVGNTPLVMRLSKTVPLTPFKDEYEVRSVFERIRRIIISEGKISIFLFNDLSTLLKLKIYDERTTPNYYDFTVLAGQSDADIFSRIKNLYHRGQKDENFKDLLPETDFKFSEEALKAIVIELMRYDFIETMRSVKINDILGLVYEEIVGESFRGDLGQHFTPRELVDFLTEIIGFNSNDKIFDPACGSGGFLIYCIKRYRKKLADNFQNLSVSEREVQVKEFAEKNLFGMDIDANMVNIAKTNMYLHGDGHSGVNKGNFLDDTTYNKKLMEYIEQDKINIIFTNPPFNDRGDVKFTKRGIEILPTNGILATVVSDGTLNNTDKESTALRELVKTQTDIIAIVSLPEVTFLPWGSGAKTSLIIVKKKDKPFVPQRVPIFMAIANDIGYDYKNRKYVITGNNDLVAIAKNYGAFRQGDFLPKSKFGFGVPFNKLRNSLAAQYYYNFDFSKQTKMLGELVDVIKPPITQNESENMIKYIKTIDTERGEIIYKTSKLKDAPRGARYKIPKNSIIVNRLVAHKGGVSVVDEELDDILATNEFIVLQPKEDSSIMLLYIFNYLRRKHTRDIMHMKRTGSRGGGRLMPKNLLEIPIPVIDDNDYEHFIQIEGQINYMVKEKQRLSTLIEDGKRIIKEMMEECWK